MADQGKPSWEPGWLWHAARGIGGALSHVPGLGGIKNAQNDFSWGKALKTAVGGGLEAGGAFLGAAAPLAGLGAAGTEAAAGTAADAAAGSEGASWLSRLGGLGKGAFGVAKAHPLMTLAGLGIGGSFLSKLTKGGAAGVNQDDVMNAMGALGVNISGDEANKRLSALKGFEDLGYSAQDAMAQVFPEISQHMQQQQNLLTQQISQFMNPYVQQVRSAAAEQAKILTGLLPSVARKYRPVLSAFIGGEQQMANANAANQALAALSGGVGFPEIASSGQGGGGNLSQLAQLAQQVPQQQGG